MPQIIADCYKKAVLSRKRINFIAEINLEEIYPYPVFLKLNGRKCTVVGGGNVALRKILELAECGAEIKVIAESPSVEVVNMAGQGKIELLVKSFEPKDIEGSFLVIAATDNREINALVAEAAGKISAIVNAVDDPENCDFYSGAVLKRGPLRIAVSTSGSCPGLAGSIRTRLEELFGEKYAELVRDMGEMRRYVVSNNEIPKTVRDKALSWLIDDNFSDIYINAGKEKAWEKLKKIISS